MGPWRNPRPDLRWATPRAASCSKDSWPSCRPRARVWRPARPGRPRWTPWIGTRTCRRCYRQLARSAFATRRCLFRYRSRPRGAGRVETASGRRPPHPTTPPARDTAGPPARCRVAARRWRGCRTPRASRMLHPGTREWPGTWPGGTRRERARPSHPGTTARAASASSSAPPGRTTRRRPRGRCESQPRASWRRSAPAADSCCPRVAQICLIPR